jgi:hypothetical protein
MYKRTTGRTNSPDVEIRTRNKPRTNRWIDIEELRPTGEASHIPDEKLNNGCGVAPGGNASRRVLVATPNSPTATDDECRSCGVSVPDGQTNCRFCLITPLGSDATSTDESAATTFLGIVHLVVESTTRSNGAAFPGQTAAFSSRMVSG